MLTLRVRADVPDSNQLAQVVVRLEGTATLEALLKEAHTKGLPDGTTSDLTVLLSAGLGPLKEVSTHIIYARTYARTHHLHT